MLAIKLKQGISKSGYKEALKEKKAKTKKRKMKMKSKAFSARTRLRQGGGGENLDYSYSFAVGVMDCPRTVPHAFCFVGYCGYCGQTSANSESIESVDRRSASSTYLAVRGVAAGASVPSQYAIYCKQEDCR